MVALAGDYELFSAGMTAARDAVYALADSIAACRPVCPHCKRPVIAVGSRPSGQERVRYLGCRRCAFRVKGTEVVDIALTGHRSSNYQRERSGRFAPSR